MNVDAAQQNATIDLEPERVAELLGEEPGPQLIDVREPYEREAGHIAGTRHIELERAQRAGRQRRARRGR